MCCVCVTGASMAGRASTVTNASLIQDVCTAHVWSPGSVYVTPTGAATFVTKVYSTFCRCCGRLAVMC